MHGLGRVDVLVLATLLDAHVHDVEEELPVGGMHFR